MSTYDIAEVQVYKLPDGSLVPASDVQPITAYQTGDGKLYETKEAARGQLLSSAFEVVGNAAPEDLAAAYAATSEDSPAWIIRIALFYITSNMGAA